MSARARRGHLLGVEPRPDHPRAAVGVRRPSARARRRSSRPPPCSVSSLVVEQHVKNRRDIRRRADRAQRRGTPAGGSRGEGDASDAATTPLAGKIRRSPTASSSSPAIGSAGFLPSERDDLIVDGAPLERAERRARGCLLGPLRARRRSARNGDVRRAAGLAERLQRREAHGVGGGAGGLDQRRQDAVTGIPGERGDQHDLLAVRQLRQQRADLADGVRPER